jgi:hypothetical protein
MKKQCDKCNKKTEAYKSIIDNKFYCLPCLVKINKKENR